MRTDSTESARQQVNRDVPLPEEGERRNAVWHRAEQREGRAVQFRVLPQGGGADILSFAKSYVTTAGDLKHYFSLNYPANSIHELVVCLDCGTAQFAVPEAELRLLAKGDAAAPG